MTRVTELMREVQTVKQALHSAETNGEAHKIALERATMVRDEEIRKLKEEIESYRCEKNLTAGFSVVATLSRPPY